MPFLNWYRNYQTEITWWIIGWLSFSALDCIIKDNLFFAIFDIALIYFNYKLWRGR